LSYLLFAAKMKISISKQAIMKNPFQSTVSKKVVEDFLSNLSETDLEAEVSNRLQDIIFQQGKFTEAALRSALFDDGEND